MIRDAGFNEDRTRRYWLLRRWHQLKPCYAYIGLNPSKADERRDDPTIMKGIGFTDRFGGGSLLMLNANDLVATDPREMKMHREPCSQANYEIMVNLLDDYKPERVVCMWGANGGHMGGDKAVLKMLKLMNIEPWCFKLTAAGQPYHPLYLPWTTELIRMPA